MVDRLIIKAFDSNTEEGRNLARVQRLLIKGKQFNPIIIDDVEFITLQIIPDRNIDNYSNILIINAITELYKPLNERIDRAGLKLKLGSLPKVGNLYLQLPKLKWGYTKPVRLYFDILILKDKITFYLTVPKECQDLFEQKIDQTWEHSSINVSDTLPEFIHSQARLAEMRYRRNDLFSLRTDRDDIHPLSDQLTIIDHMQKGDMARINIMLEPLDIKDWLDGVDDTYQGIKKGNTPRRKFEFMREKNEIIWRGIEWLLRGSANFILEFITGEGTQYKPPSDSQIEIMMRDGKLSNPTIYKMSSYPLRADINILVESFSQSRADTMLRNLCNSYKSLSLDNDLEKREINKPSKSLQKIQDRSYFYKLDYNIMSEKECAKLIQLPTAGLQEQYPIPNISTREFNIPKIILDSEGIPFSVYPYKCKEYIAHMPTHDIDELCLNSAVIGGMGQGKTQGYAANLALESFLKGYSVISIDVAKGQISHQILNTIPKDKRDKVIHLDFGDLNNPIPLDWVELVLYDQRAAKQRLTTELVHFLEDAGDNFGARTRMYMEMAAKTVFSVRGTTLLDVSLVLKNKKRRQELLSQINDPFIHQQWLTWDELTESQRDEFSRPIHFRMNTILGNENLRNILCQPAKFDENGEPLINFRKWMDEGYLILIDAKKSSLSGPGLIDFMNFLVSKIWLSALTRDEEGEYTPCMVILDEPHQYLKGVAQHFEQMFVESRKWRLKLNLLFHSWSQLRPNNKDLVKLLESTLCHWHIYSTSEGELRNLKSQISPYTIEEALKIKKHWAINHVRVNGSYHTYVSRMIPPPENRLPIVYDPGFTNKCSKKFGRPVDEVEASIYERQMILFKSIPGKGKK